MKHPRTVPWQSYRHISMSVSHITVVLLHPSGTIFNWDVDIGTAFVFKNVCLVPFPWKYTRCNDRCRKETMQRILVYCKVVNTLCLKHIFYIHNVIKSSSRDIWSIKNRNTFNNKWMVYCSSHCMHGTCTVK